MINFFCLQVSCRHEDVYTQWNEGCVGQGASWPANEAQGAADVGTAAQYGGQQGCHLGEAHRSENKLSGFLPD